MPAPSKWVLQPKSSLDDLHPEWARATPGKCSDVCGIAPANPFWERARMLCLHPHCPMGSPASSWAEVLDRPEMKLRAGHGKTALLAELNNLFAQAPSKTANLGNAPKAADATLIRLFGLCPCLYNQVDRPPSAQAIVHLCELAVGGRITDANVSAAFRVQHPKTLSWVYPPARAFEGMGGTVMELLCSEVLTSGGIPPMELDGKKWPIWRMPGHILLNRGRMNDLKALGDILIPCAPTNLVISVKSETAKERLLYSGNTVECIGFGFFKKAIEFKTERRMQLFKRVGFSAIYMPDSTFIDLEKILDEENTKKFSVNINGTSLYRPFSQFSSDMNKVVGRSAFDL